MRRIILSSVIVVLLTVLVVSITGCGPKVLADLTPGKDPANTDFYCKLVTVGAETHVVVFVKNQGLATSAPTTTRIVFFLDEEDQVVEIPTPAINPGQTVELPSVKLPTGFFSPDGVFKVIVDIGNCVEESIETNNEVICVIVG